MVLKELNSQALIAIENDVFDNLKMIYVLKKSVSRKIRKANVWILIGINLVKKNNLNISLTFILFEKINMHLTQLVLRGPTKA